MWYTTFAVSSSVLYQVASTSVIYCCLPGTRLRAVLMAVTLYSHLVYRKHWSSSYTTVFPWQRPTLLVLTFQTVSVKGPLKQFILRLDSNGLWNSHCIHQQASGGTIVNSRRFKISILDLNLSKSSLKMEESGGFLLPEQARGFLPCMRSKHVTVTRLPVKC